MRPALLLLLAGSLATCGLPLRAADNHSAQWQAIEEVARSRAQAELGKPLRLSAVKVTQHDAWALVHAHMQAPSGADIDYRGTIYADAAARGQKSASYVALLRGTDMHWTVIADSVGPTDEGWQAWRQQYRAPASLFGEP